MGTVKLPPGVTIKRRCGRPSKPVVVSLRIPLTGEPVYGEECEMVTINMSGTKFSWPSGEVWLEDVDGLWYKELPDGKVEWLGSNPQRPSGVPR